MVQYKTCHYCKEEFNEFTKSDLIVHVSLKDPKDSQSEFMWITYHPRCYVDEVVELDFKQNK